jgi:hypothetical protein
LIGDKINVFSPDKVFRRAKDSIDLYALARRARRVTAPKADSAKGQRLML